jgi:nicotinate phosphoribosyltransferase
MRNRGHRLKGVCLESGDMAALSKKVRNLLDETGLSEVKIFASGGFDESKIAKVLEEGARIDAFGVGTKVGVPADALCLDIA